MIDIEARNDVIVGEWAVRPDVDADNAAVQRITLIKRCYAVRPWMRAEGLAPRAVPRAIGQGRENLSLGGDDRVVVGSVGGQSDVVHRS